MKKVLYFIIYGILCCFIITFLFIIVSIVYISLFTKTDEEYHLNDVKIKTNVDVKKCKILKEEDTHGGFLGDGSKKVIYKCDNKINLKGIKINWNKLPFSENLNIFLYGGTKNGKQYLKNKDEYVIPKIENGYYYFIDDYGRENKDIDDIHSDEKLLDRYSYNFSLTVYDINKNYLYYYEIDS